MRFIGKFIKSIMLICLMLIVFPCMVGEWVSNSKPEYTAWDLYKMHWSRYIWENYELRVRDGI